MGSPGACESARARASSFLLAAASASYSFARAINESSDYSPEMRTRGSAVMLSPT